MVTTRVPFKMDLGVRRPQTGVHHLTDAEIAALLGKEEAARLNFISMMMEGIAMQTISEWIVEVVRRKVKEYRTYTRAMQQAMGGYWEKLKAYWGDRLGIYAKFFDMALEEASRELHNYRDNGMANEISRQLGADKDREAALALAFTVLAIRDAGDTDRRRLDLLSGACGGRRVVRDRDPHIDAMLYECRRMQRKEGLDVEVTDGMLSVVRSFHCRMHLWFDQMIREEEEAMARAV